MSTLEAEKKGAASEAAEQVKELGERTSIDEDEDLSGRSEDNDEWTSADEISFTRFCLTLPPLFTTTSQEGDAKEEIHP